MIDRKYIGHDLGTHSVDLEKGRLAFFARTVGETNPVYSNEESAKAAGYPSIPAMPTFYFSMDLEQEDALAWLAEVGIDIGKLLHGMQDFEYFKPAFAGQRVFLSAKITDIFDKKGGALEFVIKEVSATDEAGDLLAKQKITLVVRH